MITLTGLVQSQLSPGDVVIRTNFKDTTHWGRSGVYVSEATTTGDRASCAISILAYSVWYTDKEVFVKGHANAINLPLNIPKSSH